MPGQKPKLRAAVATDKGSVRSNNEDSYHYDTRRGIFILSDGMGGHAGGEIASAITVEAMVEALEGTRPESGTQAKKLLADAMHAANREVLEVAKRERALDGMGATAVAAIVHDWDVIVGNVGDSRAYSFSEGKLRQLTKDHKRGEYLSQAIGQTRIRPDVHSMRMEDEEMFLLCSDGLTDMVSDAEIARILRTERKNLQIACYSLVDAALAHGGHDNITIVLFQATS